MVSMLTGVFRMMETSLTGSIDSLFCEGDLDKYVSADCRGDSPSVECSCCIKCCDPTSRYCEEYPERMCDGIEEEVRRRGRLAHCNCGGLSGGFSCTHEDENCPTCNEDGSVCGFNDRYGYSVVHPLYFWKDFRNVFKYTVGRNETITWHEVPEVSCDVWVDGEACNACTVHRCRDGHPARYIDCTNIVKGSDGIYDTCQHYETGGVFEFISWWDQKSWSGCLPFYYRWSVNF